VYKKGIIYTKVEGRKRRAGERAGYLRGIVVTVDGGQAARGESFRGEVRGEDGAGEPLLPPSGLAARVRAALAVAVVARPPLEVPKGAVQ